MDKTMLNSIAHQKPSTVNPLIILDANKINKALITKVNKPRVKIFIGKVKMITIGFRITLITASKAAIHKAAQKLATVIPGRM